MGIKMASRNIAERAADEEKKKKEKKKRTKRNKRNKEKDICRSKDRRYIYIRLDTRDND